MKVPILGFEIDAGSLRECAEEVIATLRRPGRLKWLACINPHSYVLTLGDREFAAALRGADWLIPDGVGIVVASRILRNPVRERVSGPAMFHAVSELLNRAGGRRVFFLGGTPGTLARIEARMRRDYPAVQVAGTLSPPFKAEYSGDELDEMIRAVNAAHADVLWVGLTAPKQEKWIFANRKRLNVPFIAAVGAVFDFYAGTVKPAPAVFRRAGLEWLPRLAQQPRRLWRRTLVSAPIFLWHVLRARVSGSGLPRS